MYSHFSLFSFHAFNSKTRGFGFFPSQVWYQGSTILSPGEVQGYRAGSLSWVVDHRSSIPKNWSQIRKLWSRLRYALKSCEKPWLVMDEGWWKTFDWTCKKRKMVSKWIILVKCHNILCFCIYYCNMQKKNEPSLDGVNHSSIACCTLKKSRVDPVWGCDTDHHRKRWREKKASPSRWNWRNRSWAVRSGINSHYFPYNRGWDSHQPKSGSGFIGPHEIRIPSFFRWGPFSHPQKKRDSHGLMVVRSTPGAFSTERDWFWKWCQDIPNDTKDTLPETNSEFSPEKGWLED